jgi:hypothetical protein
MEELNIKPIALQTSSIASSYNTPIPAFVSASTYEEQQRKAQADAKAAELATLASNSFGHKKTPSQ